MGLGITKSKVKALIINVCIFVVMTFPFILNGQNQVDELKAKKHESYSVSYSYDGNLIATGGENEVIIWDANERNTIVHRIVTDGGIVLKAKFSPDGYFLVTANQDATAKIYSVGTGLLERQITSHQAAITSISFSPDGEYVALGSADHTISIYDMWKNIKVGELIGHKAEVSGVDFSPKGDLVASCSYDGKMILWSIKGDQYTNILEVKYGKRKRLRDVSFDSDGKKIAVASDDGIIRVFNVENKNISLFLRGHKAEIYDIEFSSDNKYLFSGSFDGTLRAWDVETGDEKFKINRVLVYSLSVNHRGDRLLVAQGDNSKSVNSYDISKLNIQAPPLKEIFSHTNGGTDYLKPKQVRQTFSKVKPKIALKQPELPADGEVIKTTKATMRIKGTVVSESPMHHFSVNGLEIPIIEDSTENFNYELRLAYGMNTVTIKAIDVYENEREYTFKIARYVEFAGVTDQFDNKRIGKDYALMICSDEYGDGDWNDLKNPVKDGLAIKKRLEKLYGFEVEFLQNPTKAEIYLKLREYNKKIFADDDQLFIFIAGHGDYDKVFEEGYIVATDSKYDDEIKESYISHSNLKTIINNIECDHTFLMLDVCFGGTFDNRIAQNNNKRRGEESYFRINNERFEFIKTKLSKNSRLFISSGGKEYVPDSNGAGHSPFCAKFLKALDGKGGEDRVLTFLELFSVMEVAKPAPVQGKFGNNDIGSDFLFISDDK